MNKYTRKQINQQSDRFRKTEFVAIDDVEVIVEDILKIAIECGADEDKLMSKFGGDE